MDNLNSNFVFSLFLCPILEQVFHWKISTLLLRSTSYQYTIHLFWYCLWASIFCVLGSFFTHTTPSITSIIRQFLLSQCHSQFIYFHLINSNHYLPSPTLLSTSSSLILSVPVVFLKSVQRHTPHRVLRWLKA